MSIFDSLACRCRGLDEGQEKRLEKFLGVLERKAVGEVVLEVGVANPCVAAVDVV